MLLGGCWPYAAQADAKATAVFLNPGSSNEFFWVGFTDFMRAAADDLGIDLKVEYAERDPQTTLAQVRAVVKSGNTPDYLVFTNENYVAPEVLRLTTGTDIKLFVLHNQLTDEQQQFTGGAREKYPNWIGSAVANNEQAGYLTAKALLEQHPNLSEIVAVSGNRQTPVAQERVAGLMRALDEYPYVTLHQVVQGNWLRQRSKEQVSKLIKRYPSVRLIWTASDEMAFGAIEAMQARDLVAGQDFYVATMNNSQAVLGARLDGSISALAAGHFTLGGWAMVMLADHANGVDFAQFGGAEQRFNLFQLLDDTQSATLLQRVKEADYAIDFNAFSARSADFTGRYRFTLTPLLSAQTPAK